METTALLLPLLAAGHFLWIRLRVSGFPSGDEGSWMAVAAQLSHGEGFTTRWLEHHWLQPYDLPRPDDFRYPGLTLILAGAFGIFGAAYATALGVAAAIFLALVVSVFFALRKALGFWPAFGASLLTAFSALQLQWNANVYTEGLFGLVLAAWVGCALGPENRRRSWMWWAGMGAGVGLLYLVRPNGMIVFAGLAWQFFRDRRRLALGWNRLAAAAGACLLVSSPWLIRGALLFGNPFHIAGSAGLMRDHSGQSHTLKAAEYFGGHAAAFPLVRTAQGVVRFFQHLDFFEQGLETLPLLGLCLGLCVPKLRRLNAAPASVVAGFGVSFLACAYAAWNSWAGVRYFSGFLPFAYGFGIFYWLRLLELFPARMGTPALRAAALLGFCLLPVINPHRFYERRFRGMQSAAPAIAEHLHALELLTPPQGLYYAKSLCQVNFLTDRRCVGLQELYDSAWFGRSEARFHPRLIALKRGEDSSADLREALGRYRAAGFVWDTAAALDSTFYLRLEARPLLSRGAGPGNPYPSAVGAGARRETRAESQPP